LRDWETLSMNPLRFYLRRGRHVLNVYILTCCDGLICLPNVCQTHATHHIDVESDRGSDENALQATETTSASFSTQPHLIDAVGGLTVEKGKGVYILNAANDHSSHPLPTTTEVAMSSASKPATKVSKSASCLCGAVAVTVTGFDKGAVLCHCR